METKNLEAHKKKVLKERIAHPVPLRRNAGSREVLDNCNTEVSFRAKVIPY